MALDSRAHTHTDAVIPASARAYGIWRGFGSCVAAASRVHGSSEGLHAPSKAYGIDL